jgi:RNA polymerase sigma factor (sigma-70 family)
VNQAGLQLQRRRPPPGPEQQLEQLRPFGIAYFLRCFGESLGHADAEDAVANVVVRLHRQIEAGKPPDCLRAAFLRSVRNAGIDQLRARERRPTLKIEAAAEVPLADPGPEEAAERDETVARLREALARMRGSYREMIVLRFGAGMTVPEIASHKQITMPAAKKLVMRATLQARQRLEGIEGEIFCEQIRASTKRIVDKRLAGLADEEERRILDAHLEHCGACRSFLAHLHSNLHELGATALALGGAEHSGAVGPLGEWLAQAGEAVHAAADRARYAAFKASGALQAEDGGSAGALAGSAQKVAAVCGAATATTATCLATGLIGPGIGVSAAPEHQPSPQHSPAPIVRTIDEEAPAEEGPAAAEPTAPPEAKPPAADQVEAPADPAPQSQPTPAQEASEEFGFESTAAEAAPETPPAPPPPAPSSAESSGGSAGGASGGGGESFGFGG